ncbi:YraN family protein [Clostridium sp. AM58-1XD]|uniref:YraN family protein n=1 Tax=Clostridium sp. AM58-1XD TaxID=2292307 RepID=UPI000E53CC7F|nr:YraN family protein [Clostridium sp. AM58-1XD]RGZ01511.1 YraN family protein [Clostridium sp. AM58-1XD]
MNRRQTGSEKEALAASYLEKQGCRILERNYRNHCGEIDLIAKDGDTLVFVEVKYRRTIKNGWPEEAVDLKKQKRIRTAACLYLAGKSMDIPCRFDVVSILGETIRWIRDAF